MLNEKQRKVVNEIDKNILLLASAGTGKTDTLSKRIANIIKSGRAKQTEILCITFTNKAAKEMEDRVKKILGKDGIGIKIKTFHSFCFDIVKRDAKKGTDIFTDFIIFDEDDSLEIIKSFSENIFSPESMQKFINLIKEESIKKEISYSEAINYVFSNKEKEIDYICTVNKKVDYNIKHYLKLEGVNIINTYNNILSLNHGLDFNDLVTKAKDILQNKNVSESLRKKYKYINIDEVQDTSTFEYSIIESIFYNNNILMCGDIFQTIYGWRGSEPRKIIESFLESYSPIEITFDENYRATKILTDASLDYLFNAFSDSALEVYKDGINSKVGIQGDKIGVKEADNLYEEARFVYDEIKRLEEKNEDVSQTCILTRDNKSNMELSKELSYMQGSGQAFEFVLVDEFKFFRRVEIKDVIAFLKLIGNRYDSTSLKRILKRFPLGIGEKSISEIEGSIFRSAGMLLSDFIDEKSFKGEYFSTLIKEFENNNIVIFDVESTGINVTEDEIIQIAAIKINFKGEVTEKFEKFLIPQKLVGESYYIHGFSDEFLIEKGENKKDVLKSFNEFSKDSVVVGHNVQFDINILKSELSRNDLGEVKFKDFYDTLDIYRRFHKNIKNHKLETLSNEFNTIHKPSHDAIDDILTTGELLVMAINNDIIPTSFERIGYTSKYIGLFSGIRESLKGLFDFGDNNRSHDIVSYIVDKFNLKSIYKDDKLERLRDFYILLKSLDDEEKSNRDALLDILKITSLSNGEIEKIIIKRSGRIRIPIITVHQAKGLEFDNVFICGLQDGKFPSFRAIRDRDIDEEKRTFYVGITRAKKRLYLSFNKDKGYGKAVGSRFIDFIPEKYIKHC